MNDDGSFGHGQGPLAVIGAFGLIWSRLVACPIVRQRSPPPTVCGVLSTMLSAFTTMLTLVLAGHGRIPTENEEDDVQDIYIDQDEDEQGFVPGHDVQSLHMNQRGEICCTSADLTFAKAFCARSILLPILYNRFL